MSYELSGDERLVFLVRSWKAGHSYYARIDAKENSDATAELQQLTGKDDTPCWPLRICSFRPISW